MKNEILRHQFDACRRATRIALVTLMLGMTACGGGGGGGGDGGPGPPQLIVSGNVQAPGGAIVRADEPLLERLANLVVAPSRAELTGLLPVADGTEVQLVRLGDLGAVEAVLASTTTSGGRYSFNLAELGLSLSPDMAVLAIGHGGAQMRAFATSGTVDVSPVSEAAVQILTTQLAGAPGTFLDNLTVDELYTLTVSIDFLTSLEGTAPATDLASTSAAISALVNTEPGILSFLAAAILPGQTDEGPGDIGNIVPLTLGNRWNYRETYAPPGGSPITYDNVFRITGTRMVGSESGYVIEQSNPEGTGESQEETWSEDSRGIHLWSTTDADDFITPQIAPYREALFPVDIGRTVTVVDRTGLTWPEDLDGDGVNETFDVTATLAAKGIEPITVAVDPFPRAVRVEYRVTADINLSSVTTVSASATGTVTRWLVAGIGPVKESTVVRVLVSGPGGTVDETGTTEAELIGYEVEGRPPVGTLP